MTTRNNDNALKNIFMSFAFWASEHHCSRGSLFPLVFSLVAVSTSAAEPSGSASEVGRGQATWAQVVEADFPFFSSVLDARRAGNGLQTNNLTPRGMILNLGHESWACFDTDLLRMSAIWVGQGVSPVSMSQGSYHSAGTKAPEGQNSLPQIVGTPWLLNGIYPGWQTGEQFSLTDPREPAPDKREVGRGPLPASAGRFRAVRLTLNALVEAESVIPEDLRERYRRTVKQHGADAMAAVDYDRKSQLGACSGCFSTSFFLRSRSRAAARTLASRLVRLASTVSITTGLDRKSGSLYL